MYYYAIKQKSTNEVLFLIQLGESYALPKDKDPRDFEVVSILVPEIPLPIDTLLSEDSISKMAEHFGMTISDFIEKAAKAFGVPPCATCQLRKQILYAVDRLGWWQAGRLLLKTFLGKPFNDKDRGLVQGLWPIH